MLMGFLEVVKEGTEVEEVKRRKLLLTGRNAISRYKLPVTLFYGILSQQTSKIVFQCFKIAINGNPRSIDFYRE